MARIVITLEIDGAQDDADTVVDALLDAGLLQDAINAHESDAGPLRVTSAAVADHASEGQAAGPAEDPGCTCTSETHLTEDQILDAVCKCILWCCPELPEITAATVRSKWRRFL